MRIIGAVLLCSGCAGLAPRLVDASVQKPSNVAVYFTVDTRSGDPVPGLTAEQFHIYEDGKLVSPYESKQTILNPEIAAKHYTLLLVDMSGSVSKSGQLPALQEAVNAFTSKVGQYQETAVYAFDGRPDIFKLRDFAPGASTVNVSGFSTQDPSTNLNGAAIKAMELLDKHLDKSPAPLRFGTLVVFTDGTDHASRATKDQLMGWVNAVPFDIFVIGVGAEINEVELQALGRSGSALSRDPGQVGAQFDMIATRIEGYSKRFYLLSYCSPARAGDHVLTVQPFLADGRTGDVTYNFNANGFTPNCDPNRKPSFDIKKPRQAQRP